MTKFYVTIRLGEIRPTIERVREAAPLIKAAIERLSNKDCQLVFTTPDGSTFGYLLQTDVEAWKIRDALCGNSSGVSHGSILHNEDAMLVIEVGDDFSGHNFSRAGSWLQHR